MSQRLGCGPIERVMVEQVSPASRLLRYRDFGVLPQLPADKAGTGEWLVRRQCGGAVGVGALGSPMGGNLYIIINRRINPHGQR